MPKLSIKETTPRSKRGYKTWPPPHSAHAREVMEELACSTIYLLCGANNARSQRYGSLLSAGRRGRKP